MFLPSNITLKFGDSGDFVAELQRRLARVNCFAEDQVNSFYDGNTVNGVTSFQSREGLHADGIAGPETLRRLNGVIAGDTSGSSDKKEEEAKAREQTSIAQEILQPMGEATYDPFAPAAPSHAPYGEEAYRTAATEPLPPVVEPPKPAPQPEQRPTADLAIKQEQLLAATPSAADMLAHMAVKEPPPVATEAATSQLPPPHPADFKPAAPVVPPQPDTTPTPEQQPKSMVGKAVQFASGMMQKLGEYFEAKLPPSVLKEVQSIGVTMASAGLKEAPIPGGPEMVTAPPKELPTRGPEAAQQRS